MSTGFVSDEVVAEFPDDLTLRLRRVRERMLRSGDNWKELDECIDMHMSQTVTHLLEIKRLERELETTREVLHDYLEDKGMLEKQELWDALLEVGRQARAIIDSPHKTVLQLGKALSDLDALGKVKKWTKK